MDELHDSDSLAQLCDPAFPIYRAYRIRWAVVLMLALLNGTNAFLWISFAPVADHFMAFYSTDETFLNWMQLIFPLTTVLFGLPASLFVDWFGVRVVLFVSATANILCGLLRLITSLGSWWSSSIARLTVVVIGQVIASVAQPLCMFTPTKLALDWFPDGQRTIANTIGSLGNSMGVLLGSALVPVFVRQPADIPTLNYISMGLVILGLILTAVIVRHDKPKSPPSTAAAVLNQIHSKETRLLGARMLLFLHNVRQPLACFGFWLLMCSFGCGLAYFTALSTLFEQILCTKGYSNQYAGLCGALLICTGMVASGFSAWFADRTGLLIEAVKVCYILSALGTVGFSVALYFPHQSVSILLFVSWLGAFGFAQYSLALELAAEATFPVPESITTGLLIIFSQILSIVFVQWMQATATDARPNVDFQSVCGPAATPKVGWFALLIHLKPYT
ncbi:MFS transporter, FLVCR family, MFS-domain-containing protein 7 [Paragonimus westermani]|uniref:MFS transporter, FLVCR family, MFS-domain-containing protein 7 n=1 Tax=Paragonimus westermani TaxID=34504 RepID=A0A5J4NMV2_9TREM|nr:MFS transporter, FLVCR family, MFS-domain-containing protein 7 [Paragonimus westermani]